MRLVRGKNRKPDSLFFKDNEEQLLAISEVFPQFQFQLPYKGFNCDP